MFASYDNINGALDRLAALMDEADSPPVGLLVCGGAALNVLGLIRRSTRDIDVICITEDHDGNIRFVKGDRLPFNPPEIVDTVARDLGLPMTDQQGNPLPNDQKWINLGPHRLLDFGLPDGIEKRLTKKKYRKRLTVYFIGRTDQIPLKLFACLVSDREIIHFQDLMKLAPSEEEIQTAVAWLTAHSISERHRKKLREVLWNLNYVHIADQFGL